MDGLIVGGLPAPQHILERRLVLLHVLRVGPLGEPAPQQPLGGDAVDPLARLIEKRPAALAIELPHQVRRLLHQLTVLLFRIAQRTLGLLLRSEVVVDEEHRPVGLFPGGCGGHAHRDEAPALVTSLRLGHDRPAGPHPVVDQVGPLPLVIGHDELGEEVSHRLGDGVAEEILERRIDPQDPPLAADGRDGVRGAGDQLVEEGAVARGHGLTTRQALRRGQVLPEGRVPASVQHGHQDHVHHDEHHGHHVEARLPCEEDGHGERAQQDRRERVEAPRVGQQGHGGARHEPREHNDHQGETLERQPVRCDRCPDGPHRRHEDDAPAHHRRGVLRHGRSGGEAAPDQPADQSRNRHQREPGQQHGHRHGAPAEHRYHDGQHQVCNPRRRRFAQEPLGE